MRIFNTNVNFDGEKAKNIGINLAKLGLIGAGACIAQDALDATGDSLEALVKGTSLSKVVLSDLSKGAGKVIRDFSPWAVMYASPKYLFKNSTDKISNGVRYITQAVASCIGIQELGEVVDTITPDTGNFRDAYNVLHNRIGDYVRWASLAVPFIDKSNKGPWNIFRNSRQ